MTGTTTAAPTMDTNKPPLLAAVVEEDGVLAATVAMVRLRTVRAANMLNVVLEKGRAKGLVLLKWETRNKEKGATRRESSVSRETEEKRLLEGWIEINVMG